MKITSLARPSPMRLPVKHGLGRNPSLFPEIRTTSTARGAVAPNQDPRYLFSCPLGRALPLILARELLDHGAAMGWERKCETSVGVASLAWDGICSRSHLSLPCSVARR